ncbi:MAG: hypothetical protein WC960_03045 [Bacteroidales bacterium]
MKKAITIQFIKATVAPFIKRATALLILLSLLALSNCSKGEIPNINEGENPEEPAPPVEPPFQRVTTITNYVEYRSGNLPIILSAPHGGSTENSSYTRRSQANTGDPSFADVRDNYTIELTKEIDSELYKLTGKYPYIIMLELRRWYVDANREEHYAVPAGSPQTSVYRHYHSTITSSRNEIKNKFKRGLLIDIHGHGHTVQQVELGYSVTKTNLDKDDGTLQAGTAKNSSSIYGLTQNNKKGYNFVQLLRGTPSFGSALKSFNIECVPNHTKKSPGAEPYFNGGYITVTYGSMKSNGDFVDAIQMEFPNSYRAAGERNTTAKNVAKAILKFLEENYPFEEPLY